MYELMEGLGSTTPPLNKACSSQTELSAISTEEFRASFQPRKWTWYQFLYQVICFILFLGPLRLVVLFITALIYIPSITALRYLLDSLPLPKGTGNGFLLDLVRFAFRIFFLCTGVVWIDVKGVQDPDARFLIANHCSMMDPFIILMLRNAHPVIKSGVGQISWLRPGISIVDPVYVDRTTSKGQARIIADRANDKTQWPILLFPEGTITDGTVSLKFHRTAFITKQKVQPYTIRYHMPFVPKGWNSYSWTDEPAIDYLLRLFSMPPSILKVEVLPCVDLENEGKGDVETFALNTQLMMMNRLNIKAVMNSSHERYHKPKEE